MRTRKPCASAARRSNIRSARIKGRLGATHFLIKTLPKVAAETTRRRRLRLTRSITGTVDNGGRSRLVERCAHPVPRRGLRLSFGL